MIDQADVTDAVVTLVAQLGQANFFERHGLVVDGGEGVQGLLADHAAAYAEGRRYAATEELDVEPRVDPGRLATAYEAHRGANGLPASYDTLWLIAEKT